MTVTLAERTILLQQTESTFSRSMSVLFPTSPDASLYDVQL